MGRLTARLASTADLDGNRDARSTEREASVGHDLLPGLAWGVRRTRRPSWAPSHRRMDAPESSIGSRAPRQRKRARFALGFVLAMTACVRATRTPIDQAPTSPEEPRSEASAAAFALYTASETWLVPTDAHRPLIQGDGAIVLDTSGASARVRAVGVMRDIPGGASCPCGATPGGCTVEPPFFAVAEQTGDGVDVNVDGAPMASLDDGCTCLATVQQVASEQALDGECTSTFDDVRLVSMFGGVATFLVRIGTSFACDEGPPWSLRTVPMTSDATEFRFHASDVACFDGWFERPTDLSDEPRVCDDESGLVSCDLCTEADESSVHLHSGQVVSLARVRDGDTSATAVRRTPVSASVCPTPADTCGGVRAYLGDAVEDVFVTSDGELALLVAGDEVLVRRRGSDPPLLRHPRPDEPVVGVRFHRDASALAAALRSGLLAEAAAELDVDLVPIELAADAPCQTDDDCVARGLCTTFCTARGECLREDDGCDGAHPCYGGSACDHGIGRCADPTSLSGRDEDPLRRDDRAYDVAGRASFAGWLRRCQQRIRGRDPEVAWAACVRALELAIAPREQVAAFRAMAGVAELRGHGDEARLFEELADELIDLQ